MGGTDPTTPGVAVDPRSDNQADSVPTPGSVPVVLPSRMPAYRRQGRLTRSTGVTSRLRLELWRPPRTRPRRSAPVLFLPPSPPVPRRKRSGLLRLRLLLPPPRPCRITVRPLGCKPSLCLRYHGPPRLLLLCRKPAPPAPRPPAHNGASSRPLLPDRRSPSLLRRLSVTLTRKLPLQKRRAPLPGPHPVFRSGSNPAVPGQSLAVV
jgi:hypothetical protein